MEHVLLGFDGSDASVSALEWVAARANRIPSRVTLTAVAEFFDSERAVQHTADEGAALLSRLAPTALVERKVLRGFMPGAFVESDRAADLVVVGSHLYGPVRSVLTGWVPLRVSLQSIAPACVVPVGWTEKADPVVVGYTDDGSADAALRFAASEASKTGRRLLVVHTWLDTVLHRDQDPRHRRILDRAAEIVAENHPALPVETLLMDDEAAEVLESLSSSASLIVIGSHRYGALAGGFVGSVAWFLVGQMNAPLCVVPPESFEPLTATPSASSRPLSIVGD